LSIYSVCKLFDFFKDLNSDSEGNVYEGQLDIDEGTLEQINSHINLLIRKDEIFKCVRKLKNEKASGEDEIINEYKIQKIQLISHSVLQ
jgi:hypothetical protein